MSDVGETVTLRPKVDMGDHNVINVITWVH